MSPKRFICPFFFSFFFHFTLLIFFLLLFFNFVHIVGRRYVVEAQPAGADPQGGAESDAAYSGPEDPRVALHFAGESGAVAEAVSGKL